MNEAVQVQAADCKKSLEERPAQGSPALQRAWQTATKTLAEEYVRKTVFIASLY